MTSPNGTVYLIGAGPGDPELMTVRAMRLLQVADVVIHDRLIPHEVLTLCRPDAQLIDVGKYPDHHRVSQTEINELLIAHAQEGATVVRLKGGDPFVFGRGFEEVEACRSAGVPCAVVPGISSALAGPTAAGIPVTTRGVARSFVVITGQTDPNLNHELDYSALTKIDTIVVLMGRKNLRELTSNLIHAKLDASTPATCIENATLTGERTITGTVFNIAELANQHQFRSPMITVIGMVAAHGMEQPWTSIKKSVTRQPKAIDSLTPRHSREQGKPEGD